MHLKQFYLGCLAHASYLIADPAAGVAAVVDPQRDIDIYVEEAARLGVKIRHVLLTHFHADFLAGHLELRDRVGAAIGLGSRAQAEYAFHPLADGEDLWLGAVRLRALHTPGHTPESITLLAFEPGAADPELALTGDTLFLGDVGRPDLRVALGWSARELGEMLYDSLHQKILPLPDTMLIYPAHGAGSLCGKNISRELVGTLGDQRRLNYALQPMPKDDFLRIVLADQPEAPAYFTYDAVRNTQERPSLDTSLERHFRSLSFEAAAAAQASGAVLLDTRPPGEHARAHWRGAINIPLEGAFATWCGTLVPPEASIVVIAEPGREREAGVRLGRIGFDRVAGYLEGGMAALAQHPELIVERLRLQPVALAAADVPCILDVRTPSERAAGAIERSLHVPLSQLAARRGELPRDRLIVVYCQGGYRSAIAASLLQNWGFDEVADLEGGYFAAQALH